MRDIRLEHTVEVRAPCPGRWRDLNQNKDGLYTVRVGSCFRPLYISSIDRYQVRFPKAPELIIELNTNGKVVGQVCSMKVETEPGKETVKVKDFFVKSSRLDVIRPNYEATKTITKADKKYTVAFSCRVIPETPKKMDLHPAALPRMISGQVIEDLSLEVLDEYDNHVKEGEVIFLRFEGLSFQDGSVVKVYEDG